MPMPQERVTVREHTSAQTKMGGLIITVYRANLYNAHVIIGRPGQPNVDREQLRTGGAVLFETPDEGLFEVRILSTAESEVEFLVSHVSPRPGIAGGWVEQDASNVPFTRAEVDRIAESIQQVRLSLSERADIPD